MRTTCLILGLASLAAACEGDKPPRTREEFCRDWSAAACSEETVSACQAASAEECRQSQEDACRGLVPEKGFSDAYGDPCIDAVGAAYADGDLEDAELLTVLRLGPPCDKLSSGSKSSGESCGSDSECDGPAGYACVRKADAEKGSCELPEEVEPGRNCSAAQKVCTAGFYCNGDNCVESKEVGDACQIQEECGEEGYCDEGKCAARVKVGRSCGADYECASGICDSDESCTDRIRLARSEPICGDLR